jgi:hypothetical protein
VMVKKRSITGRCKTYYPSSTIIGMQEGYPESRGIPPFLVFARSLSMFPEWCMHFGWCFFVKSQPLCPPCGFTCIMLIQTRPSSPALLLNQALSLCDRVFSQCAVAQTQNGLCVFAENNRLPPPAIDGQKQEDEGHEERCMVRRRTHLVHGSASAQDPLHSDVHFFPFS